MNKSIKRLIEKTVSETIKEVIAGGGSFHGAPSFGGGPYGFGNKMQLKTNINPATRKIEKMEQDEVNANVEDQDFINRKFKTGLAPFYKAQDIPRGTDEVDEAEKEEIQLFERNAADSLYTHLPGFPGHNAIEYPIQHVPEENKMPNNLRAGVHDGTEDYVLDDIIDELEENENRLNEFALSGGGGHDAYNKKSALPPFFAKPPEVDSEEAEIGHLRMPSAEESPIGSAGAVMFPKKFVPNDKVPQQSDIFDYDLDGISDDIDLDQPSEIINKTKE
jgi:hypothetical protein